MPAYVQIHSATGKLIFVMAARSYRRLAMTAQLSPARVVLELEKKSSTVREFETILRSKIVGQDEAVSQLVSLYQTVLAGMAVPERPIANLLFLGPTGSGKTRIV